MAHFLKTPVPAGVLGASASAYSPSHPAVRVQMELVDGLVSGPPNRAVSLVLFYVLVTRRGDELSLRVPS